jgi:S-layer protein
MTNDTTAGAGNEDIVIGSTTAPTGAVTVSASGKLTDAAGAGLDDFTMGDIAVTGGSSVDVTVSAGITSAQETAALTATTNDTVTQSGVIVTGSGDTTEVTVTQDDAQALSQYAAVPLVVDGKIGIVNGAVTIADANAASATKAGTITTVTLDSFGAATVNSSALTDHPEPDGNRYQRSCDPRCPDYPDSH